MLGTGTHRTSPSAGALAYNPALDGVRAIAVAGVFAYHLEIGILPGGFMGVDLFFVLSGFLITTLLLREHARTGAIRRIEFWLRRARRLLPALFLLLGAVALAAIAASPFDRDPLRWDILSALGYVANWRFIAAGQSYFQEFAAPSPVKHLWSLAIEEQFYVVWPLLALGGLALASRRRWGGTFVVSLLLIATLGSAVLLGLSYDELDPSTAYYSTLTRAHELLIGAIAAVLLKRYTAFTAIIRRVAGPLAFVASLIIGAFGMLLRDSSSAYYLGGSVVFSLAAAALVLSLAAGPSPRRHLVHRALSMPPLPWIGAMSYGLYLWHWPLIVWLTPETTGLEGPGLVVLRVVGTLVIAVASFFIVERPIRRGTLGRYVLGPRPVLAGALAIGVVVASLAVFTTSAAQPIPEFVSNNRKLLVTEVPGALGAIGLVGDSVAMSLYPGFVYEAATTSRSLGAATFPGCPIGDAVRVDNDGVPFPFAHDCPGAAIAGQEELIDRLDPGIVFWLSARDRFAIRVGEQVLRPGSPEWEEAAFADWDRVLARLTARGARVAVVLPFHRTGDDPSLCAGDDVFTAACTGPNLSTNSLREEYRQWASRHPDSVLVLNPDPVVCPSDPCPGALDGVELRTDRIHFTQEGALVVARRLVGLLPAGFWDQSDR